MTGYAVKVAELDATLPKVKRNVSEISNINVVEKKINSEDNKGIRHENNHEENNNCLLSEDLIFVDQKETEDIYTIPAAFGAYTKYMNIRLGQEKYR